ENLFLTESRRTVVLAADETLSDTPVFPTSALMAQALTPDHRLVSRTQERWPMMLLHIHVTQRDINRGAQGDSFRCPVALAVKRAFKADKVWVREVIIIVTKGRSQQTHMTPPEVEGFLESYDSAILEFESPRPFSFTLGGRPLARVKALRQREG